MPSTSRVSLVRGPALCTWNAAKFFSKEDFGIKLDLETIKIGTSAGQNQDERVVNVKAEANVIPEGRFTNALIGAIWTPFATYVRGTSLLTGTDLPFVASASDGEIHTIIAGALTKLPDLYLSAKKTLIGAMTISGYRGLAKGWADSASIYTVAATGGSIADTTYTPSAIPVQAYTGAWGSVAGFTSIDMEEGWTVSFNLKVKEWEVDTVGKILVTFEGIDVMAKCIPVGPTSTQIIAATRMQASGTTRGYSLANPTGSSASPDLVITGADGATVITLKQANIKSEGFEFGNTKLRNGEIGFVATRPFASGAEAAIFSIVTSS